MSRPRPDTEPADRNWHRPGFLTASCRNLAMDGVDLVALARSRGTPLLVYSERRLVETARGMMDALRRIHPNTTVCYASKACSLIAILQRLNETGVAFEVNSGGELFKARTAGIPADRIVYNGVAKNAAELLAACDPPVKAINIDSLGELERLAGVLKDTPHRARVALRIVPGIKSRTAAGNQTGSENTKFGLLESELPEALRILDANRDRIALVGLHAHIGSQIADADLYAAAAQRLATIARALNRPLEHINIGGGFALPYLQNANRSPQDDLFLADLDPSDVARGAMPPLREALGRDIEILVEPGRRIIGECAVLLATVDGIKQRTGCPWLILDAGYHTIVESYTYKWYYHCVAAGRLDEAADMEVRLLGPLCDSGDAFHDVEGEALLERVVASDADLASRRDAFERMFVRMPRRRMLPAATRVGDVVAFLDTGAYLVDQMTPNNGRPRPEIGMIGEDGRYRPIRRGDSQADLLFNEVF
jgi:diaminopimelate decarboxylase